jgi:hypothetical protein
MHAGRCGRQRRKRRPSLVVAVDRAGAYRASAVGPSGQAVTTEGHRDILGIWAGDGGEGAKYWLQVFTELKNRGLDDVRAAACHSGRGSEVFSSAGWKAGGNWGSATVNGSNPGSAIER